MIKENPCSICGETDASKFGKDKHRKEVGVGKMFYIWLEKNHYPEGYRILCHNCNMSYGLFGYCPHKGEKNE